MPAPTEPRGESRDAVEADRWRTALARRLADLSLKELRAIHQVLAPPAHTPSQSESANAPKGQVWWPHAPEHRLSPSGIFLVTAATYRKQHHFRGAERLNLLRDQLLLSLREGGWQFEAWAIFSNHYHFVAHGTPQCGGLAELLQRLHSDTAEQINARDRQTGRQVWFNFWESELTFHTSYQSRLNYVHQKPVKHGLVTQANQYPWCSAHWFETTASRSQVRTIYGYGIERVKILDDFDPIG
jgi:putative transposase